MRVEIAENGSSYVLTVLNQESSKKHVAKFVEGILIADTGLCSINIDIEKKSGHLLYAGQEYRRLQSGESFEYAKKAVPRF